MSVGSVGDAQIDALVSRARLQSDTERNKEDAAADALKKVEEQRLQKKAAEQRQRRLAEQQGFDTNQLKVWSDAKEGKLGSSVQRGVAVWGDAADLQKLLSERQKTEFMASLQKDPVKTSAAGALVGRMLSEPAVKAALGPSTPVVDTLHAGILNDPDSEPLVRGALGSSWMGSQTDPGFKSRALRVAFEMHMSGDDRMFGATSKVLSSATEARLSPQAHEVVLGLGASRPLVGAMDSVDAFIQRPSVMDVLPRSVASDAVSLVAKAPSKVSDIVALVEHSVFQRTPEVAQRKVLGTVDTLHAMTHEWVKAFDAGSSSDVPTVLRATGSASYRRFFRALDRAIEEHKNATTVVSANDPGQGPDRPNKPASTLPNVLKTAQQARAESVVTLPVISMQAPLVERRALLGKWFDAQERSARAVSSKIAKAKYKEDLRGVTLSSLPDMGPLRELDPEYVERRLAVLEELREEVQRQLSERNVELQKIRRPPKRPVSSRPSGEGSSVRPSAAAEGSLETAVATSLQQPSEAGAAAARSRPALGSASSVQTELKKQVVALTREVAELRETVQALLQGGKVSAGGSGTKAAHSTGSGVSSGKGSQPSWQWGSRLPSTSGEMAVPVDTVKPVSDQVQVQEVPVSGSVFEGNMLWIQLPVQARLALQNLGWTQQAFDSRHTQARKIPVAMSVPYGQLNMFQKMAVSQLGFTEEDWNSKVNASRGAGL